MRWQSEPLLGNKPPIFMYESDTELISHRDSHSAQAKVIMSYTHNRNNYLT